MAAAVNVEFADLPLKDVVAHFQETLLKKDIKGVNLILQQSQGEYPKINLKLANPVSLAAAIQLIENQYAIRFILRDYGIAVLDSRQTPAGATLVSDFVKKDAKSPSK